MILPKINWLPKLIDNYHFQAISCSCVFHVLSLVHALTPRHGSATRPIKGLSQSPRVQVPRRFNNREIFNLSSVKSVKASDAGRPGGDEHHKKSMHQLWRWFQRKLSWHFSWHWSCWPPLWAATQPTRTVPPLLQHLVNTASLSTRDVGFSASRCLWNTSQNWHKQHLKEVTIITFTRMTIVTFTRVTIVNSHI